jgi:hypothetical protein
MSLDAVRVAASRLILIVADRTSKVERSEEKGVAREDWTLYSSAMSFAEIVSELPRLSRAERRELACRLFDLADEESAILADCDRRADERFRDAR